MMSNLPVLRNDLMMQLWKFDPIRQYEFRLNVKEERAKLDEKIGRIHSGESTLEKEFGPFIDIYERLHQHWDAMPSVPRKYALPKHLRWMGCENGQQSFSLEI
jgi:hypothetical protein